MGDVLAVEDRAGDGARLAAARTDECVRIDPETLRDRTRAGRGSFWRHAATMRRYGVGVPRGAGGAR
jgi:hypothetical protein